MKENAHIWKLMSKGLTGKLTTEEKLELGKLLEENAAWRQTYADLQKLNIKIESSLPLTEKELEETQKKAFQRIENQLQSDLDSVPNRAISFGGGRKYKWIAVAATVVVLLGVGFFFLRQSSYNDRSNGYTVSQHEKKTFVASKVTSIVLKDGTKVWLNQSSVLKCNNLFGHENRKVTLEGEAFFDVAQHADHPFIVQLKKGIKVKALGTRFNVKAYTNSPIVETALLSGKVALTLRGEKANTIILSPKEKVKIDVNSLEKEISSKEATKKAVQVGQMKKNPIDHKLTETAWMENRLSFDDISFVELGYELERSFGKKIIFKDKKLKEYHLTGSFKGKGLQQILEALKITTPFQYKMEGNKVILSNKY